MKDRLSVLLDGELDEESGRLVLDAVDRDATLRKDWDMYCLIGDALRGERLDSPELVSRVMGEIAPEPALQVASTTAAFGAAANGPWRALMPLAASLMGVAAVGWVAHAVYVEPAANVQVAGGIERVSLAETAPSAPVVPVQTVSATPAQAEDPYREYVLAHQAMTGGGPIPGAVQYVRTVSASGGEGGR